ncbi:Coq4 family protein [Chondromyces apiculatus]|uniref:Ubiquinone biosynthesis protein n=1 Tax=Chondromyces apiculatus DSM 436 TaxID=1192034 RepID=A0A017T5Z2_9BACT|nr:Coq4 family protein [Chondromyces apiculatus]EYF04442.1 Hypothetical protein CAP_4410 [Chondromyces apiculatus DSM 436]
MTLVLPQYDLPRALRAVRVLLRDPDDLPMVFALTDAMAGTAPFRLLRGFRRCETGRALLGERRDIVPLLADRAALRALPAGTLGRAYLEFVEREGISAEGIRDASAPSAMHQHDTEIGYVQRRMRDTHDLWHAATGYQGDVVGELALLAFFLGQHWNTAIAMLVVAGLAKTFPLGISDLLLDGFRRGRAAEWLPAQDWEALLTLPLDEVRARLELGAPAVYKPVRTSELRMRGIV